ncbi:MAG TPA: hypothetical protein VGD14_21735 [bacterium]
MPESIMLLRKFKMPITRQFDSFKSLIDRLLHRNWIVRNNGPFVLLKL